MQQNLTEKSIFTTVQLYYIEICNRPNWEKLGEIWKIQFVSPLP